MGKMGAEFLARSIAIGQEVINLNQRVDIDKKYVVVFFFPIRELEKVAQEGGRYLIPGNSQGQVG